jgi:hypothetical protein
MNVRYVVATAVNLARMAALGVSIGGHEGR